MNYEEVGCVGCGLDADNCICGGDEYDYRADDDHDKWVCAFPGACLMPGEHMRAECHTRAMYEASVKGGAL